MTAFDTPRTKALAAFLLKEGPAGSGRVTGLSIEGDDGVFIYTESAQWCDDNGSGTFRGDSETKAIRAFYDRVQRNPSRAAEAKESAFLASHAAPLPAFPALSDLARALECGDFDRAELRAKAMTESESYVTLEIEGRPVATLSRPRVLGRDKLYSLALTDGRTVAAFDTCPTRRRCLEAVYSYARSVFPDGCDPAAELESYQASFAENWTQAEAGIYLTFRASSLTRAARWARRIALALEALAAAPDCLCLECGAPFHMGPAAVQICPACYPEGRAEAVARVTAEEARQGRLTLDQLEEEAARAKAEERARRLTLDQLEEEAARAPKPRPMAEGAGLGDVIRRAMGPADLKAAAALFGYPLAPTRAAPAPLWPVAPRRAFAELAAVMGGR